MIENKPKPTSGRGRKIARSILIPLLFIGLIAFARSPVPREWAKVALEYMRTLGHWAPVLFILAYILACLTFFPGVLLTLGAGILFGVLRGTIMVVLGASLGAACAFLVSRYLARRWVIAKFGHLPHFKAVDEAVAAEGWKIVGLIRLSPAFPFTAMNFIFGLTRIPFWHFFCASAVGLVPLTALFVYIGWLTGDLADLGARPAIPGNFKWIILAFALITTVIVTGLVTKTVRRALKQPDPA